jgi:hypothetical protein
MKESKEEPSFSEEPDGQEAAGGKRSKKTSIRA